MSNYSGNKNRKNRIKNDAYQTPYSMTHQLFENYNGFDFNKSVLEPAAGKLAMIKILKEYFKKNICWSDLTPPPGIKNGLDFFEYPINNKKYDYIITNPPFKLVTEFILKSMEIAKEKFALLMKIDFLTSISRYEEIYSKQSTFKFGLKYVKIFVRKPDLRSEIREDGKYNTGIDGFAWYIWEKGYNKKPMISWINNQIYILKKESDHEKEI